MQQCDVTATYEFIVELAKFYNVDLFLRGMYSLRVGLRTSQNSKLSTRVECTSARGAAAQSGRGPTTTKPTITPPPLTTTTTTTTHPFRILFRNEEITLDQLLLFRVTIHLDIKNLQELTNVLEFKLELKLLFNDSPASSRELIINLQQGVGVNYYRPVFFDYFYLSAVGVAVHGGLIALHLAKGLGLEPVGVGVAVVCGGGGGAGSGAGSGGGGVPTTCVSSNSNQLKLRTAQQLLLQILINANTNLRSKLAQLLKKESSCCVKPVVVPLLLLQASQVLAPKSCGGNQPGGEEEEEEEDLWINSSKQMSQLCAENILVWHKFLDNIIAKEDIRSYLARLHHQARIERFTEGFYVTKNPLRAALLPKDYTPIVELLKKSIIYKPLPLECLELDGDESSIPIIFEDQYIGSVCGCLATSSTTPRPDPPLVGKLVISRSTVAMAEVGGGELTTLPRRHSSPRQRSGKLSRRRYASTPLLNELDDLSSESGWVSEESVSSGSSGETPLPPMEFRDPPPISSIQQRPRERKKFGSLQYSSERKYTRRSSSPPPPPPLCSSSGKPPFPFQIPDQLRPLAPLHLIICVHGLDGSAHDLRLFKVYLEVSLPGHNLHFLMSEKNQDTFSTFEQMTQVLVDEILCFIKFNKLDPARVSFVGHSLGCVIIRSALARKELASLVPKLHTFLSLSGPHLGTMYNGGIVNVGMWLMQKWKKSTSLLQLQLRDAPDLTSTFMYKLSLNSTLHKFKYILLTGSVQDRYVPLHSAHIINCKQSLKDGSTTGSAYRKMVSNLLGPILKEESCTLIRYDVHHCIEAGSANALIGRAAHIAVLDSEVFIEKFLGVGCLKYFL